mgnify:CR=1 FL=1
MKLYVGNLPYDTTDAQLRDLAAAYGTPSSAEVAKDRSTGQARGFGFVEFANDDEARAADAAGELAGVRHQRLVACELLQVGDGPVEPVHGRIPEEQHTQQLVRIRQPRVELPMMLSLVSNRHAQVGGLQNEIRRQDDEVQSRQPE